MAARSDSHYLGLLGENFNFTAFVRENLNQLPKDLDELLKCIEKIMLNGIFHAEIIRRHLHIYADVNIDKNRLNCAIEKFKSYYTLELVQQEQKQFEEQKGMALSQIKKFYEENKDTEIFGEIEKKVKSIESCHCCAANLSENKTYNELLTKFNVMKDKIDDLVEMVVVYIVNRRMIDIRQLFQLEFKMRPERERLKNSLDLKDVISYLEKYFKITKLTKGRKYVNVDFGHHYSFKFNAAGTDEEKKVNLYEHFVPGLYPSITDWDCIYKV